jgi:hypothetical protein
MVTFERGMFKKIYDPERKALTGRMRNVYDVEIRNLYRAFNVNRVK